MRSQFRRVDLQILVHRREDDGVSVLIGQPGSYDEVIFSPELTSDPAGLASRFSSLFHRLPSYYSFLAWLKRFDEAKAELKSDETIIPRITLDIIDPELASLPLEPSLASCFPPELQQQGLVVRVSAMRPGWASTPFTVPLRILSVEPANRGALPSLMRDLIGRHRSDETASRAVQVHECAFFELKSTQLPADWPTAEILHFGSLPSLNDVQSLLKLAEAERPGTLGWFARVGDLWQTRLIVIECHSDDEVRAARRLAAALIGRAGPAVLVVDLVEPTGFFEGFYRNLLHDFPLDQILLTLSSIHIAYQAFPMSLFAGAGREEALRISSLGLALLKFEAELSAAIADLDLGRVSDMHDLVRRTTTEHVFKFEGEPLTYDEAGRMVIAAVKLMTKRDYVSEDMPLREVGIKTKKQVHRLGHLINIHHPDKEIMDYGEIQGGGYMLEMKPDWTVRQLIKNIAGSVRLLPIGTAEAVEEKSRSVLVNGHEALVEMKDNWKNIVFEFHEGEGFLPLSEKVNELRTQLDLKDPLIYQATKKVTEPRHINASLWSSDDNEGFRQLDQNETRLRVGEVYHLGIQIAPKDLHIRTVGETTLFEEAFNWSPEMEGVWVEFAITRLDFEVLGDPVRELWLPRDSPSEMIYFAVSPRIAGACRLRYCLYYQQNVIQSFRLAAITLEPKQQDLSADERRQRLAAALDLSEETIGDAAYLPRLEYSLTTSMESLESRPPRVLSIVANDLDGKSVVSVKGAEDFDVLQPGDLSKAIANVRNTFTNISANKLETEPDPLNWPYAFGKYADQPKTLENALMKLADVGWRLYDKIFLEKTGKKLEAKLTKDGEIIHVAHILLEKVIPWAALYDRQYKPEMIEDDELRPVEHAACTVALPDADGKFPTLDCRTHPACLLHPDQIKKRESSQNSPRLVEETVACPLHFWGFRHNIEIPPQPVDEDGVTVPQHDCILSGNSVQMIAGANAKLRLWSQHEVELKKFTWKSTASRVATLNKALKDEELDFIYFYCHAGGGVTDPAGYDPYLLFQDVQQAQPEKLRSGDFPRAPEWSHHPLVFLNGCGTLGFSPDALSPFIKKLVRDLSAAGVIGTEITVWEELATVVAKSFLEKFLAGKSAGEALLDVRRSLLFHKNPLGLVYTLYAPAHLKLKNDGNLGSTALPSVA